jgi:ferrochelatase
LPNGQGSFVIQLVTRESDLAVPENIKTKLALRPNSGAGLAPVQAGPAAVFRKLEVAEAVAEALSRGRLDPTGQTVQLPWRQSDDEQHSFGPSYPSGDAPTIGSVFGNSMRACPQPSQPPIEERAGNGDFGLAPALPIAESVVERDGHALGEEHNDLETRAPGEALFDSTTGEQVSVTHEATVHQSDVGILLINSGTPDAARALAVRRYFKKLLADRRVIEKRFPFGSLVHDLMRLVASSREARAYQRIWNLENNEAPSQTVARSQAHKLAVMLDSLRQPIPVAWAMRYGSPSIQNGIRSLVASGCDRILIMPLFPQYAAYTTATVVDEVCRCLMRLTHQPAVRFLPPYYKEPSYIQAVASSLVWQLEKLPFRPEVIVASYGGIPQRWVGAGDPYEQQCIRTTALLREYLKLGEKQLLLTYEPPFGGDRGLQPYTASTIKSLAQNGATSLVVVTPGFAVDCLTTLETIALHDARLFKRHGGKNFAAIQCLNDKEEAMLLFAELVMRELKGWI